MRVRPLVILFASAVAAAVCVRLGFWQLGRWQESRRLNARQQSLLAAPPLGLWPTSVPPESAFGRTGKIMGRFDETRQFLLLARFHAGEPGVEIVTPLVDSGPAVLVDRGWVGAADGATATPPSVYPDSGRHAVTGVIEHLGRGVPRSAMRPVPKESRLFATESLDWDSVSARLPYPAATWMLRQLPVPGVPTMPIRQAPEWHNESMHLGYTIQWFAIALILLIGGWALARARGQGSAR